MTMEYRRETLSQTWHFCRACSKWPYDSFNIFRVEKFPPQLPLCNECIVLAQQDKCSEKTPSLDT